jgi:glycerate kinase
MKVLVVPDKFKGTLTAQQAAEALARGWRAARPDDELEIVPMSDGGDGFGQVLGDLLGAPAQVTKTVDAAHRPLVAEWWWDASTRTAVVEAARVNGLAQLPRGKFHPFELDTFGLGAVLRDVAARGARRCIMGIGGSATNDGGFGVARALGWEFCDVHGRTVERWTALHGLAQAKGPPRSRWFEELTVAVDVNNPLLGERGCARVYGPQKGLKESDFGFAERCLGALAEVARKELHLDTANEPGAGAAGGLGFGLRTFLGARLTPGFGLFAEMARLGDRMIEADLVLTGEGAIDGQTLMGKGVGELALLCRRHGKPCVGIGGVVTDADRAGELFRKVFALVSFTTPERARAEAGAWLEVASKHAAETF